MHNLGLRTWFAEGVSQTMLPGRHSFATECRGDQVFMDGSVQAQNLSTLLDFFANCSGLKSKHAESAFLGFDLFHEEEIQYSRD